MSVSSGSYHNCVLRTDGQIVCWGQNIYGQLGIGNTTNIGTSPTQMGDNLQSVDLGTGHPNSPCVLKTCDSCWPVATFFYCLESFECSLVC